MLKISKKVLQQQHWLKRKRILSSYSFVADIMEWMYVNGTKVKHTPWSKVCTHDLWYAKNVLHFDDLCCLELVFANSFPWFVFRREISVVAVLIDSVFTFDSYYSIFTSIKTLSEFALDDAKEFISKTLISFCK